MKFLIIWRFFRLAALAAGTDAPENMRRCFANNYDVEVRAVACDPCCTPNRNYSDPMSVHLVSLRAATSALCPFPLPAVPSHIYSHNKPRLAAAVKPLEPRQLWGCHD